MIATICYGITGNEIKSNLKEMDAVKITMFGLLFTGPFPGIYLMFSKFPDTTEDDKVFINLGFVVLLAIFSSACSDNF